MNDHLRLKLNFQRTASRYRAWLQEGEGGGGKECCSQIFQMHLYRLHVHHSVQYIQYVCCHKNETIQYTTPYICYYPVTCIKLTAGFPYSSQLPIWNGTLPPGYTVLLEDDRSKDAFSSKAGVWMAQAWCEVLVWPMLTLSLQETLRQVLQLYSTGILYSYALCWCRTLVANFTNEILFIVHRTHYLVLRVCPNHLI